MAHTSRQHKLSERAQAHMANVTSYRVLSSSSDQLEELALTILAVSGEILSSSASDNTARRSDTRQRRPNEVIISFTPASLDCDIKRETFAGRSADVLSLLFCSLGVTL